MNTNLNRRISPQVAALLSAMTLGFHPCQRQYWRNLMMRRYLIRRLFGMRSQVIVKNKIARADHLADFEDFCYGGYYVRPTLQELRFCFFWAQKLWPIHLERAGESSFLCERYRLYLQEKMCPSKKIVVQPSRCDLEWMHSERVWGLEPIGMYMPQEESFMDRRHVNLKVVSKNSVMPVVSLMMILLSCLQIFDIRQLPVFERKEKKKPKGKFNFPPPKPLSPPKLVPQQRQRQGNYKKM
jgi:hypothetical protein